MITYADTAINLLDDKEDGLRKQVDILTDSKYDKPVNRDDEFTDAATIAKDILEQLRDKAKAKKAESESLKSKLEAVMDAISISFPRAMLTSV